MKDITRLKNSFPDIFSQVSDLELENCISAALSKRLGCDLTSTIRQSAMLGRRQSVTLELFTSDASADLGALRGVSDHILSEWLSQALGQLVGSPLLVLVRRRLYERPVRHGARSGESVGLTILVGAPDGQLAVMKPKYTEAQCV